MSLFQLSKTQLFFRLAIAHVTFSSGVFLATVFPTQPTIPPVEIPQEKQALKYQPACFPGLSLGTEERTSNYFPRGLFGANEHHDDFVAGWYAKHLTAMNERTLLQQSSAGFNTYRFLWLRSFHHPIMVRVDRLGDQVYLTTKELDGKGGYDPGSLLVDMRRPMTEHQWATFQKLLDGICYWQLPTHGGAMGNDGAQWILEAQVDGRYHIVDRWTPDKDGYRAVGIYLLTISDLRIDLSSDEVY